MENYHFLFSWFAVESNDIHAKLQKHQVDILKVLHMANISEIKCQGHKENTYAQ